MQHEGSAAASVGLVCGEPVWEHAISWLLRSGGHEVVARARDVERAADIVVRAAPEVLVVDVDGEVEPWRLFRRMREVHQLHPDTQIVVVCTAGDTAAHDAALAAGASRVVWRENALDLLRAVGGACPNGDGQVETRPQLTLREFEILRLVAEGRTNREVARCAWVTEQTVKYHLANIYRRLGVRTRAEAVAWAAERGVVTAEQAVET